MARSDPTRNVNPSGNGHGDRQTTSSWLGVLFLITRDVVSYAAIAVLAIRAWQEERPWLGLAVFGGGSLLVMGWATVQGLRDDRHRSKLLDRLRQRRRDRAIRASPDSQRIFRQK